MSSSMDNSMNSSMDSSTNSSVNSSKTVELFCLAYRARNAWRGIPPRKNLTKAQFGTLLAIYKKGLVDGKYSLTDAPPVTLTELAVSVRQSLPALSQRAYVLETLGYVRRQPNPIDRRTIGLWLTEEGLRVTENVKNYLDDILERAFAKLGADAGMFVSLLAELVETFEDMSEDVREADGEK